MIKKTSRILLVFLITFFFAIAFTVISIYAYFYREVNEINMKFDKKIDIFGLPENKKTDVSESVFKKLLCGYPENCAPEICLTSKAKWENGFEAFSPFEIADIIIYVSLSSAKNKDIFISVADALLTVEKSVLKLKIVLLIDLSQYCGNKNIDINIQPIPTTLEVDFVLNDGYISRLGEPLVKIWQVVPDSKMLAKALGYLFQEKTASEVVDKYLCNLLCNLGKIYPVSDKCGVVQQVKFYNR